MLTLRPLVTAIAPPALSSEMARSSVRSGRPVSSISSSRDGQHVPVALECWTSNASSLKAALPYRDALPTSQSRRSAGPPIFRSGSSTAGAALSAGESLAVVGLPESTMVVNIQLLLRALVSGGGEVDVGVAGSEPAALSFCPSHPRYP